MEGSVSGQSQKQHLLSVYEQTGEMPRELAEMPEEPSEVSYLWSWICQFTYPLSFTELESWQRLTRRNLSQWEITALVALDKVRSL